MGLEHNTMKSAYTSKSAPWKSRSVKFFPRKRMTNDQKLAKAIAAMKEATARLAEIDKELREAGF